jgi:hypothetical protein
MLRHFANLQDRAKIQNASQKKEMKKKGGGEGGKKNDLRSHRLVCRAYSAENRGPHQPAPQHAAPVVWEGVVVVAVNKTVVYPDKVLPTERRVPCA